MAEIIRKVFRAEIKGVDSEKFLVDAIVSDESLDRYKEKILATAWEGKALKDYKKHGVLLSSHRYDDLRKQIGESAKIGVEDNKLVAKFKYYVGEGNPEADWGFKLAEKGVAAYSVGFIAEEVEDTPYEELEKDKKAPRRVYKSVNLVEISQVLVPANPAALQRSVDSGELDMEDPVVKGLISEAKEIAEQDEKFAYIVEVLKAYEEEMLESKKWEETENEIRHRVREPGAFQSGTFRYVGLKKDKPRVFAVMGKLKGESTMTIQALRFPKKDGWTIESAKKWTSSHFKKSEEDLPTSLSAYEHIQVANFEDDVPEDVMQLLIPDDGFNNTLPPSKVLNWSFTTDNTRKDITELINLVKTIETTMAEFSAKVDSIKEHIDKSVATITERMADGFEELTFLLSKDIEEEVTEEGTEDYIKQVLVSEIKGMDKVVVLKTAKD